MKKDCLICKRIQLIKKGKNPYFVTELSTGYVVIGDHQYYRGYTLFLCKNHVYELHQLKKEFRMKFLYEMSIVGQALFNAFKPDKLNYELLGNTQPHLHCHIFPRYKTDPNKNHPVWTVNASIRNADSTEPTKSDLEEMERKLLKEIKKLQNK
ncbi:MAG: HIT family protein [Candidatus Levybacteria bacterium]|nr:HIT family protein [Candidatus Levybacteria bacterium]